MRAPAGMMRIMSHLPHLALVLNAFIWGVSWVPFKWMESLGLSILWATAASYLLSSLALIALRPAVFKGLLSPQAIWWMGLFYGLTNTCFNWALALGDVVRVVLLFYLMPVWAAIFSRWLLNERLNAEALARLVLALAGAAVVLGQPGEQSGFADALSIAGGLFFALANVHLRRLEHAQAVQRTMAMFIGSGLVPLFFLMGAALVAWGYGADPGGAMRSPLAAEAWAWLAVPLVAVALGLANFSLQFGGSRLPTQVTSLIMLSEIVFATVSAAMILGKTLSAAEMIGGACIVLAAVWATLRPPRA